MILNWYFSVSLIKENQDSVKTLEQNEKKDDIYKYKFSNPYIIATHWCCRPILIRTMNYVRSNSYNLKNKPLGCKIYGLEKKVFWSLHNWF